MAIMISALLAGQAVSGCARSDSDEEIDFARAIGSSAGGRETTLRVPSGEITFRDQLVDSVPSSVDLSVESGARIIRLSWSVEKYDPLLESVMHPSSPRVSIGVTVGGSYVELVRGRSQSETLTTGSDVYYISAPPGGNAGVVLEFDGVKQAVVLGDDVAPSGSSVGLYELNDSAVGLNCAIDSFDPVGPSSMGIGCRAQALRVPYLSTKGWADAGSEWVAVEANVKLPLRLDSTNEPGKKYVPTAAAIGNLRSDVGTAAAMSNSGEGVDGAVAWMTPIGREFSITGDVSLRAKEQADSPQSSPHEQSYEASATISWR